MGVGAGEQVDQRQQGNRRRAAGDASSGPRRRRSATVAAATAAPERQDDRGADVGTEPAGGEDEGCEQADREECRDEAARRGLRREAGQPRPGPGDDEHREQRLELVADPVEANAEAGIRPEQGERGQRRAGDHVDRVGERR